MIFIFLIPAIADSWPLAGSATSCKHKMTNYNTPYNTQTRNNICIHLEFCLWTPDKSSVNIGSTFNQNIKHWDS